MVKIAVIVSTWINSPESYLLRLLESMEQYDAGMHYDLFLCANGEDYKIPGNLINAFAKIFLRKNRGYNLGAWDHAWRMLPDYDYYLFMQDDCFIKKKGWLSDFFQCFSSVKNCGLVGENLNKNWNLSWSELTGTAEKDLDKSNINDSRTRRAQNYLNLLRQWGIQEGKTARHLTTIVHFTSRPVIEEVDGYNSAETYDEAIAAEIGFSRKIEANGYKLAQIGKYSHSRIGHREWPSNSFFEKMKRSIYKRWERWMVNR